MTIRPTYEELRQRVAELEKNLFLLGPKTEERDKVSSPEKNAAVASEGQLKAIAENITGTIILSDRLGNITYINHTHPSLTREKILSSTIFDFVPAEQHPIVEEALFSAFELGEITRYESSGPGDNGHNGIYNVSVSPIVENGNVVSAVFLAEEISEHKKIEAERHEYLLFLENLEKINQVISRSISLDKMMNDVLDEVLKIFDCDRAWLLYPCDPDAQSWRIPMEKTKPEYPGAKASMSEYKMTPYIAKSFRELLTTGKPVVAETPPENGDLNPANKFSIRSAISVAIHPKRGKPWSFGLHQCSYKRTWTESEKRMFMEISQRICDSLSNLLFFHDLSASEEKYRNLFINFYDIYYQTDSDGRIRMISPSVEKRLGYSPDEVIGKEIKDYYIYPEERTKFLKILSRDGNVENFQARVKSKDNSIKWISANAEILRNDQGDYCGVEGILRDVTDQKRLEDQLRQSRKMESIGTIAGGIAHDFNNLLYMIIGNTDLALEDTPYNSPVHKCLKEIKNAAIRGAGIVKQLLNYSRKTGEELKPTNMLKAVKESIELLRAMIPATIEIRTDFPETGPMALADPNQINQVMMNLCINAGHAMEETGGKLDISIEKRFLGEEAKSISPSLKRGNYIKIRVSDTGVGIAPEIIERIFDPYFTTKEVGKGSGMGLAVVHGIVKNHNGAITIDNMPGKGAVFNLFFPVFNGRHEVKRVSSSEIRHGNEKILFIDDEKSIAQMMRLMLGRLGYNVDIETDPIMALELFRADPEHFDIVITDMAMPQINGVKLTEKLKEIRPEIPVIICTGHSSLINEKNRGEKGIAAYVMKPVEKQKIAKVIRRVLGN